MNIVKKIQIAAKWQWRKSVVQDNLENWLGLFSATAENIAHTLLGLVMILVYPLILIFWTYGFGMIWAAFRASEDQMQQLQSVIPKKGDSTSFYWAKNL